MLPLNRSLAPMGRAWGGGSAFAPTDIAGLKLWLDATKGLYQDAGMTVPATLDNDPVGGWADQSGSGNHATQATAGFRPLLKLVQINSLAALLFDGVDDYVQMPSLAALTAGEIFVVAKWNTDPPTGLPGFYNFTSGAELSHVPYLDGVIYDAFGTTVRKTTVNPTPSMAAPFLYGARSGAGEWTNRLNGAQLYTTSTNTVGFSTTPLLGYAGAFGYCFNGRFAEVILYNSILSPTNRAAVEAYLNSKWAIF